MPLLSTSTPQGQPSRKGASRGRVSARCQQLHVWGAHRDTGRRATGAGVRAMMADEQTRDGVRTLAELREYVSAAWDHGGRSYCALFGLAGQFSSGRADKARPE